MRTTRTAAIALSAGLVLGSAACSAEAEVDTPEIDAPSIEEEGGEGGDD